jgi:hypothetical protein
VSTSGSHVDVVNLGFVLVYVLSDSFVSPNAIGAGGSLYAKVGNDKL